MRSSTLPVAGDQARQAKAFVPAVAAMLFGLFLIYGVGFAGAHSIHEAAHDSRHAFAFPCH